MDNDNNYWTQEFLVTQADIDRLVAFIDSSGQAQFLSTLAKRVIDGRLRYGHDQSTPVNQISDTTTKVRLWDPAGEWQIGDRVIVLLKPGERLVAYIGVVQAVDWATDRVTVFIPEENYKQDYGLLYARAPTRQRVVANVQRAVAQQRGLLAGQTTDDNRAETVEKIMGESGERIVSLLLHALREDQRLTLLDDRYFPRSLTDSPSESQLHKLAWSLLAQPDPLPTSDLLALIPNASGDAALFGLHLALRQHPHWFKNTQSEERPLWKLAGPPPGSFTPHHAVYDPDTCELLCVPGNEVSADVVARLWQAGLLADVV